MTTAADDSAVEDAFEALLAGRPAPQGAAGLAAFTEAVRTSATRPGRPNAALAELLATGLLTDQSSPSARTARSAGSPPARRPSRVRIRRRTAMIFPVLLAKFLSAGAVAQAATGAGVVLVAVTGVGAVGALPAPVQDTFSTVVAAVTPLTPPTSEETDETAPEETLPETVPVTVAEDAGTTEAETADLEAAELEAAAWAQTGPEGFDSFDAWVSASAQDDDLKDILRANGVSFGDVVSGWANGKGVDKDVLEALGVKVDDAAEPTPEPDAGDVSETEQAEVGATTEDSGARGNGKATNGNGDRGNGNGNGRGNGRN